MITTLANVKAKYGRTTTTQKDTQISAQIIQVTGLLHTYLNQTYRDVGDVYTPLNHSIWPEFDAYTFPYISFIDQVTFSSTTLTTDTDTSNFGEYDTIEILGSVKNDGWYEVQSVGTAGSDYTIDVDRAFKTEALSRYVAVYYINYPQGLRGIAEDMIIYDVFYRGLSGVRSENVVNYSYTLGDIGGVSYPDNLVNSLRQFRRPKIV